MILCYLPTCGNNLQSVQVFFREFAVHAFGRTLLTITIIYIIYKPLQAINQPTNQLMNSVPCDGSNRAQG